MIFAVPIHVSLDSFTDVLWTLLFIVVRSFHIPAPSIPCTTWLLLLVGGYPRKVSFSKQRAPSMTAFTLHITPDVTADIGGITLQNVFVSTLTSASQLDERNQTNGVAMYFVGPLRRQSPPDWVQ